MVPSKESGSGVKMFSMPHPYSQLAGLKGLQKRAQHQHKGSPASPSAPSPSAGGAPGQETGEGRAPAHLGKGLGVFSPPPAGWPGARAPRVSPVLEDGSS